MYDIEKTSFIVKQVSGMFRSKFVFLNSKLPISLSFYVINVQVKL